MDAHAAPAAEQQRFIPVHVESLDHQALAMDLYIRHQASRAPTLYRAAGVSFNEQDAERLVQQGVQFLYISAHQHAVYRRSLVEKLERTYQDPEIIKQEKAKLVRAACGRMIEDVMLLPGQSEAVEAVADISRTFSDWASQDADGFGYLLDMSSHDYYTTTHMMNVGVGCGLLLKELEPGAKDLFAVIVQGGLLHDVGKRKIPSEILNKEGKLDPQEWKLMRGHPLQGYEELKQQPMVPETVLQMARDHHERLDGMGYPNGLRADQISLPARICAVVDVFDAITAARPYRGPTPPMDTLKIMAEGAGSQFDKRVFAAWETVVKRMIESDPERAVASTGAAPKISLSDTVAHGGVAGFLDAVTSGSTDEHVNIWQDERRRHSRFACEIPVTAMFIRQGKPCGVAVNKRFPARILDISSGGLQLATPWPVSLNDLLLIDLPAKDGNMNTRRGRVVRPGRKVGNAWHSGILFIAEGARSEAA
jgi:HD-GYP domain-containing protein (c-di-GMP phosphodiesterase class II)